MTDCELLELAATAVGLSLEQGAGFPPEKCLGACWDGGTWDYWNPLEDDGDALRLAVSLRMNIDVGAKPVVFTEASVIVDAMRIGAEEYHDSDPYAATRRAIVRAAAEIGRAM